MNSLNGPYCSGGTRNPICGIPSCPGSGGKSDEEDEEDEEADGLPKPDPACVGGGGEEDESLRNIYMKKYIQRSEKK
jgi:hypothetical protein